MLIRLIALNARYVHSAPALFYLRRLLLARLPAAQVELRQFTINDPYYETLLQILAGSPDALFFSVYVWNAAYVRRLLPDLARVMPDLPVVLGGPEAPQLNLPADLPVSIVRGPAEGLEPEFFTELAAGRLRPGYRARPQAPFAMPYRAEDFSGELQNRHLYYESSRGCPYACSYCLSAAESGVTYREVPEVQEELAALLAWRPSVVRFVDRTFNAPPARALAIWRFLVRQARSSNQAFHFEIAPDLFDEESLDFLATVPPGLFRFEIGLQSFNRESLAAVNRHPDLARAEANIRRLMAGDNIHIHLDLILGLPHESRESYCHSLNRLLALRPHHLQLGLLKVLPDTPLAARRQEFGLCCSQSPPYPLLANRWLEQETLAELYSLGELIEDVYNPRYFIATLDYILRHEPDPAAFFLDLSATLHRAGLAGRARTQELLSKLLLTHFQPRPDAALARELLCFDWLACGHRQLPEHLAFASEQDGLTAKQSRLDPLASPGVSGEAGEAAGPGPATSVAPAVMDRQRLREAQDQLWRQLPDNLPPFFTPRSRSAFFKRTTFAPFSGAALAQVGLADGRRPGIVAFLAATTGGLKPRQEVTVFPSVVRLLW